MQHDDVMYEIVITQLVMLTLQYSNVFKFVCRRSLMCDYNNQ